MTAYIPINLAIEIAFGEHFTNSSPVMISVSVSVSVGVTMESFKQALYDV